MNESWNGTVTVFEDNPGHITALKREFTKAFAPFAGGVSLLFSRFADQKPSQDGESPQKIEDSDLLISDAIVVDLGMPLRFMPPHSSVEECLPCQARYCGVHVLRDAKELKCLDRVFVNSAYLETIKSEVKEIYDELEGFLKEGVSVFEKNTPKGPAADEYQDLYDKIFSLLDLKRLGYSADATTRDNLYLVARRSTSERVEPVLILGKTGTGKEEAARHIHRLGQRFLAGGTKGGVTRKAVQDLVVVHCGGLTAELARDELFGHVKGAFTDASGHKVGRILRAIGCNTGAATKETELKGKLKEAADKLSGIAEAFKSRSRNLNSDQLPDQKKVELASEQLADAAKELVQLVDHQWGNIGTLLEHLAGGKERSSSEQYREWLWHTNQHLFDKTSDLDLQVKTTAPFGTVFLDEFGELPPSVQALLLRFLEIGEIQPLGFEGTVSLRDKEGNLHVRFIGATNREEFRRLLSEGALDEPPTNVKDLPGSQTALRASRGVSENDFSTDSSVRADLVYRLAQWVVELPDLQSSEVEYLIEVEKNSRPSLKGVLWEPDALEALKAMVDRGRRFPGQRRQLRTVVMRAMAYASELPALGISSHFKRSSVVTEDILKRAMEPIALRPAPSHVEEDRRSKLKRAIAAWLSRENVWPDCPADFTWETVQERFGKDKVRIGKYFLLSSLFHEAGQREYRLGELEQAWGAESHNTIRGYLNKAFDQALKEALAHLDIQAIDTIETGWQGTIDGLRRSHQRWPV